jgi:hypothetical protein
MLALVSIGALFLRLAVPTAPEISRIFAMGWTDDDNSLISFI